MARTKTGKPCSAWALRDEAECFRHAPAYAEAAREASRLGGLRSSNEATVQQIFDLQALDTTEDIQRLLRIAVVDALALPNSVPRVRVLVSLATEARRLQEHSDLELRIAELERAVKHRVTDQKGNKHNR